MSTRRKITLLITCVGGGLMPQLLISIKKSMNFDITLIGVDSSKEAIGRFFCDSFYQVPFGTDEDNYMTKILELIKKHNVKIIIPASDEESLTLSKNKKYINCLSCKLVVDNYKKIKILNNKLDTLKFLKKNKVDVPFWKEIKYSDNLEFCIDECLKSYEELVLKSTCQRGSRSVFFIDKRKNIYDFSNKKITLDKLITSLKNNKELFPFMLMEKYIKPVYDIDILTWRGKLLKTVQRKRINSDFPNMGHEIVNIKSINEYCKTLVDKLGISWLYDCDIMFNKRNKPCLLEINPRQSGSLAISMLYGVNFIDDIIKLSYGENISRLKKTQKKTFVPYKTLKCLSSDV